MGVWVIIVAGVGLVAGLALLWTSRRSRRIDDHPICRRCRFDLVGVYPDVAVCPECAAELARPRVIRTGNRRMNRKLFAVGLVLTLVSGVGITYYTANTVNAKSIASFKPAWLLELEAESSDASTAAIAIDELGKRIGNTELSDARTIRLVDAALRHQANDNDARWLPSWSDLIEQAWATQAIDKDRYGLYKRQAVKFMTSNPYVPGLTDNSTIPIVADIRRASAATPFVYKVTPISVLVDGVEYEVDYPPLMGQVTGGGGMMLMSRNVDLSSLPDGPMTVVWEVSILEANEPLVTFEQTLEYRGSP